jgi:GH25 family lysozyme M1 (1,4-beta-N-acetylmuramidase)
VLACGIDISKWNHTVNSKGEYEPIDWVALKEAGVDFVIIKIGSTPRNNSESGGLEPTFLMDYEGAKAAGLGVGAYYYAYSSTVADTLEDARNVLKWVEGKQFEYPIYFDIEDESLKTVSRGTLTKIITAFIEELQSNGYYSAIYVNNEWLVEILDTNTMLDRFDVWYARYPLTDNPTWNEQKYGKQLSMWQFTDKGRVNGFNDDIDVNYCYRDYPTLMKRWGLNGFEKHPVLG